jgi:hypothetical protein
VLRRRARGVEALLRGRIRHLLLDRSRRGSGRWNINGLRLLLLRLGLGINGVRLRDGSRNGAGARGRADHRQRHAVQAGLAVMVEADRVHGKGSAKQEAARDGSVYRCRR